MITITITHKNEVHFFNKNIFYQNIEDEICEIKRILQE